MGNLFEYSKFVENQDFVGRKEEVERISANFVFLTNTVVLAPQGWGKSSLVRRAAAVASAKERKLRFCHISLTNVRDEEHFFELLAQSVLMSVSSNLEEAVNNVPRFLPYPTPKLGFASSSVEGLTVDFDWSDVRKYREMILDLPARVALETGLKLVICIDDFHMVEHFAESDSFIRLVQTRWLGHKGVAYCLSAEENVVMTEFVKTAKPFSRYGDIIRIGRIAPAALSKSLREKFADSGKYLDSEVASMIVELAENSPFHAQQIAHIAWLNTSVVCSKEVVSEAYETIVNQMHILFSRITYSLTGQQLCYLHAILAGETIISTAEVLHRHRITSATSASRSKTALLQKGIICNMDGKMTITDPIYAYWLNKRYFL